MARILIIEDNADNLELMTYLLESFGHATFSAGEGAAGVARAIAEPFDLVICDIHLPGEDGYAVAQRLKRDARTARIPLVAVTALAMVGDRERVLAAGFDSYISKPIDPQRFVATLEAFIPPERRGGEIAASGSVDVVARVAAPRRGSLIVIDDLEANLELMREMLEPVGYEVRTTRDAEDGLRLAREAPPDLIVSDLHMRHIDGFELLRHAKSDPVIATIPVVLLSSSTWNAGDRGKALALGAARFLTRPIEPQVLIDELDACIKLRS